MIVKSQSYVADTIKIHIRENDSLNFKHSLKVNDYRKEGSRFISVYEKKKWLFFPIDQIVISDKPITTGLNDYQDKSASDQYILDIHEFYISQRSSMFKQYFTMNSALELSKVNQEDTTLKGTFYYEKTIEKNKDLSDSLAYEESIDTYLKQIIEDLNLVTTDTTGLNTPDNFNFRKGAKVARKNFYVSGDIYYGYTFWGFDAEIYFSAPEPTDKFFRNSRMLRYLNYGNRESVAISSKVKQQNYRISDRWLFQNKYTFLFGFNKWHDIEEAKRSFEEVFVLQLTATQRILYNTLDESGWVFGIGLMEEASYIMYNDPIYGIGFVISCGYKF